MQKRVVQRFPRQPVGFRRRPLPLLNELGAARPPDLLLETSEILTDSGVGNGDRRTIIDRRTRRRVDMPPISSSHCPWTRFCRGMNSGE